MGRRRSFNTDHALDSALDVFWRKGYEGTSLTELTRVMGINRPSLYSAFGNKESLFRKAIDRYAEGPAGYFNEALKKPTARAVVEGMLRGSIDLLTDPQNPPGCLLVQGALACGKGGAVARQELITRRAAGEAALRLRFEGAKSTGELPAEAEPDSLARFIITVLHGMAVQSATGASRKDLRKVAETAMGLWPA